ncbi:hypothetical protein C0995_012043 [Termitomyces sp. Mi166|nr:hypothetical protein C0995_012043 [Termitomyces sp. Mi166\
MASLPPVAPPIPSPTPSPTVSPIMPNSDQIIAMAVIIFGFWNVPIVRNLINPLKLFTIALHEFCHISAAVISGGRILRITIDPHVGGATIVEGGRPMFILASGYLGSTLLGGLFVLAGYSTLVAKVMSFVLGIGLIMPLALVRDKFADSVPPPIIVIDEYLWAAAWIFFELAVLAGFILLGIYEFRLTKAQMDAQAAEFLPT